MTCSILLLGTEQIVIISSYENDGGVIWVEQWIRTAIEYKIVILSDTGHGALNHASSDPVSGNITIILFTQQFMQCMGSYLVIVLANQPCTRGAATVYYTLVH